MGIVRTAMFTVLEVGLFLGPALPERRGARISILAVYLFAHVCGVDKWYKRIKLNGRRMSKADEHFHLFL